MSKFRNPAEFSYNKMATGPQKETYDAFSFDAVSFSTIFQQESYFEKYRDKKSSGYKPFKRWQDFWSTRFDEYGELVRPDKVSLEMNGLDIEQDQKSLWNYIGGTGYYSESGRVNQIIVEPGSTMSVYICTLGGLWKTTNLGDSWRPLTDSIGAISVSHAAIDPNDLNTIYIATGDLDSGQAFSIGVMKSIDGGKTWNPTGLNYEIHQTRLLSRIVVNPDNTQILLSCGLGGIWRSTNGGNTWTNVFSEPPIENLTVPNGHFRDIKMKPGDSNTWYACSEQFYKSIDGGVTWYQVPLGISPDGNDFHFCRRIQMSVSEDDPERVYLVISGDPLGNYFNGFEYFGLNFMSQESRQLLGIFRSDDSGTSFYQTHGTSPNLIGLQGNFSICIQSDPYDADLLYVGGLELYKSTDGGYNFSLIRQGSVYGSGYADMHCIEFIKGDSRTSTNTSSIALNYYSFGGDQPPPGETFGPGSLHGDGGVSLFIPLPGSPKLTFKISGLPSRALLFGNDGGIFRSFISSSFEPFSSYPGYLEIFDSSQNLLYNIQISELFPFTIDYFRTLTNLERRELINSILLEIEFFNTKEEGFINEAKNYFLNVFLGDYSLKNISSNKGDYIVNRLSVAKTDTHRILFGCADVGTHLKGGYKKQLLIKAYGSLPDNELTGYNSYRPWRFSKIGDGDGQDCLIDPDDDSMLYFSAQEFTLFTAYNSRLYGQGTLVRENLNSELDNNCNQFVGPPLFFTPFELDYDGILYVARDKFWRTKFDLKKLDSLAGSLFHQPCGNTFQFGEEEGINYDVGPMHNWFNCSKFSISPSNKKIFWATKNWRNNTLQVPSFNTNTGDYLFKSVDSGSTFKLVEKGGNDTGFPCTITKIVIHSTNSDKVWISLGGFIPGEKVYYTSDGGQNWENISLNLPNLNIQSIVYEPGSNGGIYVGTDGGVFYRNEDIGDFILFNRGLPNIPVTDMDIDINNNILTISTQGRGIWRSPLYSGI